MEKTCSVPFNRFHVNESGIKKKKKRASFPFIEGTLENTNIMWYGPFHSNVVFICSHFLNEVLEKYYFLAYDLILWHCSLFISFSGYSFREHLHDHLRKTGQSYLSFPKKLIKCDKNVFIDGFYVLLFGLFCLFNGILHLKNTISTIYYSFWCDMTFFNPHKHS